jgi:hypothetical protein
MNEERQVQGQVGKGGGWWSGDFCEQGQGDQERWIGIEVRWVAEKEFYGEAADFYTSAADGVKEGGVGREAESTRNVGSKVGVFEV